MALSAAGEDRGLGRRIGVSLGIFVISGSLILVWWMHAQGRQESRQAFEVLAQANARFMMDQPSLPKSEKMAAYFSEILNMEVRFEDERSDLTSIMPPGHEGVQLELSRGGGWMVFIRPAESFWAQFWRRSMWVPLGLFWGLCLLLAWAISRRVVRPLVALAEKVPEIGTGGGEIPGLERRDEIGYLARTLAETKSNLIDEREKRESAERLALLGKMATGLAHEIKNPVAAIQMHAQLLADDSGESATMIVEEGRRIEGLVNQWMFLARPEPPNVRRQDVRICLGEVLDSIEPIAKHAGVDIVRELGAAELAWDMDADRMAQVFRNLATNAIHAMPGGGQLTVSIDDGAVLFSDEGDGFSEEALENWGELFFSTKEGGMGIGLSVALEIIRAHGGELKVANGESGAVISVKL